MPSDGDFRKRDTPNRLSWAKKEILLLFSTAAQKVYSESAIAGILLQNRDAWHLRERVRSDQLISFLERHGDLKKYEFRSKTYRRQITRYAWGGVSIYELALSINPRAYLCHATAAAIHGLSRITNRTIYLNIEQSAKPSGARSLTQEGIDRAFSGKQRESNLVYRCGAASVVHIAGKHTNCLAVETIAGPASEPLRATSLERTLIDIVVRPAYAGGISQVLRTYRAAKERASAAKLVTILGELDHAYPFHQAIGFLMQRTGYPKESCDRLRALGLKYNFYLAHGIQSPSYSADWRLFYPRGLRTY